MTEQNAEQGDASVLRCCAHCGGFTVRCVWGGKHKEPCPYGCNAVSPGTTCGAFGCDQIAVVRMLRGEEWFPGWYCAEHGKVGHDVP